MGVWSYDFVEAQTHDGRKLRLMTLIDEFTRSPPFGASANLTMPCHTGAAVRARHTSFACGHAENLASCTASSATQCRSNPVSGRCLPKTGIFKIFSDEAIRGVNIAGRMTECEPTSAWSPAMSVCWSSGVVNGAY